ncbi:hypothetical protein ACSMDF_06915 [Yersinia enterocolitica]
MLINAVAVVLGKTGRVAMTISVLALVRTPMSSLATAHKMK